MDPGPVLTFSWEALHTRSQSDAKPWEEYFPQGSEDELEAITLRLAREWHMEASHDFTDYDGFSLGRASRWTLWMLALQPGFKLLACLQEAMRAHGASTVVLDRSVPEPLASAARTAAQALGLSVEESAGGPALASSNAWRPPELAYPAAHRAVLKLLDAASRRVSGPAVLCSYYHTSRSLLPELRRLGFKPVLADRPPKAELGALARLGAGAWTEPHEPVRRDDAARRRLAAIEEDWRHRRSSEDFRSLCTFRGASMVSFVISAIDAVVEREFPASAWTATRVRERWRRDRPAAVLLAYDGPPFQQLLLQCARLEGTPSAIVLHGLPLEYRFRLEHEDCDLFIVWGEAQLPLYRDAGARPRLAAAGNPYFDSYAGRHAAGSGTGRSLLVLSRPHDAYLTRACHADSERHVLACLDAAQASGWEVTLKLHPCESQAHYERLVSGRARVIRDQPIADLLERADAVVGPFSTALIESLLLERPTLCVNFTREPYPPPFDGRWGLEVVREPAELARRLSAATAPTELASWRAGATRALDDFIGPRDGGATVRAAEAVAKLARMRAV